MKWQWASEVDQTPPYSVWWLHIQLRCFWIYILDPCEAGTKEQQIFLLFNMVPRVDFWNAFTYIIQVIVRKKNNQEQVLS